MREYGNYDATGLADLVLSKEVSPLELLDAAINRVEAFDSDINAVITEMYDLARRSIADGLPEGPLAGVPFLLKDIRATYAGVPTSSGSAFLKDYIPDHDSTLVSKYKESGLVIFGKTNTPEFACCPSTEGALFGATKNPWNTQLSAGGSSGGSAAAVAAGYVPAAHGSDGGGSIRIPASCCGIFGFKPSRGLIAAGPDLGEAWNGLSTENSLTRSVRDCALFMDIGSGRSIGDPYNGPEFETSLVELSSQAPGPLKIAVQTKAPNGAPVHQDCIKAVNETVTLLTDLGHHVEEASPEYDSSAVASAYTLIIAANVQAAIDTHAATIGRKPEPSEIEPIIKFLAAIGHQKTASELAHAIWTMHRAGRDVGYFFSKYDALVSPVVATPPPVLGTLDTSSNDVDAYLQAVFNFIPFTAISNQAGIPSMSVPLHWNDQNVPIGVHFMAGYGKDDKLLQLASQLETAQPWGSRRPQLNKKGSENEI